MAREPRRDGLRSTRANQARVQEAQRVEDAGIAQYQADATKARATADAGPPFSLNPRSAAATREADNATAARAEARLAGARQASAEGFDQGTGHSAQPAPAASPPAASPPAARPAAPRVAAPRAPRAAPVTSEADKLNEISLALAQGQTGPFQPGTARANIARRMGYAKGGYVRQDPGWSLGGKGVSGAGSDRYSKRRK